LGKNEIADLVKQLYGLEFENQHLYDAWCIWRYGKMMEGELKR